MQCQEAGLHAIDHPIPTPGTPFFSNKQIHLTAILSLNNAFNLLNSRALMIYIRLCSLGF